MKNVRNYTEIILRPKITDERGVPLGPVVTHHYPDVGFLTPLMHGRTKLWHISIEIPYLDIPGHWVDPDTVSSGGFITKREALEALVAGRTG